MAAWFAASAASSLEGPRALEQPWADDPGFRIEWGETWQATCEANTQRWKRELEAAMGDRGRREQVLALRRIRLLEALIERYPKETEKALAARREIADCFVAVGCPARANYSLKKLAEGSPGRPEVAADALLKILQRTSSRPSETEEGEEWIDYAASRLIALNRVGHLPDGHPAVGLAWRARLGQCMRQHRVWEASKALGRLAELTGSDDAWQNAEAELYFEAGRRPEALERFQELAERNVPGPASGRVHQLADKSDAWPASFPTVESIEAAWDIVRSGRGEPNASAIQSLIERSLKGDILVPAKDSCHTSLWGAIDRHLRELFVNSANSVNSANKAASALRGAQERLSGSFALPARQARDAEASVAVYRRYPWAMAVHAGLLEYGENALRLGHSGLARRAFEDVLTHASNPRMLSRARVGLWLAVLNETGDPGALGQERLSRSFALPAAFQGVQDDALLPWMGESKPAILVKKRLLSAAREPSRPSPPSLSQLQRRVLRVPPVSPWPADPTIHFQDDALARFPCAAAHVRADGGKTLLSGPNLLAVYGSDLSEPLWWRTAQETEDQGARRDQHSPSLTVPGPFLPALAGGRLYSRWGMDSSGQHSAGLAAFDSATGEMAWSTARDPAWAQLSPLSDPAVADGRVYILATRERPALVQPVFLVCLDAESGTLLWQRLLCTRPLSLYRADGAPGLPRDEVDLTRYGSALTVHEGAVYCQASAGFVARCDARDGLVEWLRTYPRVRLGSNTFDVLRRQGGAPLIAGDAAVFLPRDYEGLFALDKATGRLLWDKPFVPSHEALGLAGGTAVVRDAEHLIGLDVSRGEVVWERRFDGGIRGRPVLLGLDIYVATRDRVLRLAADTGRIVEQLPWDRKEPLRDFIVRGDSLVALTDASLGASAGDVPRNPEVEGALRLPLQRMWDLYRPRPKLIVPPAEAKVAGRFFLLSGEVLECLAMGVGPVVQWQRVLPRDPLAFVWAEETMVLVYPQHVLALDASTGARRWETELPFRVADWRVCGPDLFVGDLRRDRRAGLIRLSSGQLLWHRQFRDAMAPGFRGSLDSAGWDGEHLHLLVTRPDGRESAPADFVVRPADGQIAALRRLPAGDGDRPHTMAMGGSFAFVVPRAGAAYAYALRDGATERHSADFAPFDTQGIERIDINGPWVQVRWSSGYQKQPHASWILRRGDPAYELRRPEHGRILGEKLFEVSDKARTVTIVDLPSRRERTFRLPTDRNGFRSIVDCREGDGKLWVVSSESADPSAGGRWVRVDVFASENARHLGAGWLDGLSPGSIQTVWGKESVFIADAHGLHAFVPAPPGTPPGRPIHLAYAAEGPVRVDGSLDEWRQGDTIPLRGDPRRSGTLRVAHDTAGLYLAVSYPGSWLAPWDGRHAGDWVEFGLTTNAGSYRWGVGVGARGRAIWDGVGAEKAPEAMTACIGRGPGSGEVVCEVAIPLERVFNLSDGRWRQMGLSLTVWDDQRGGRKPARVLSLGGALAGPYLQPAEHMTVYLCSLTREQEAAASVVLHELPDLPASFEFLKMTSQIHATSDKERIDLYWDFIKRHPASAATEQLLIEIDKTLREKADVEPCAQILERAAASGAPETARRRYECYATAYLSQWVHLAKGAHPRSVLVMLNGGVGGDEWGYRGYWGEPARNWIVPPTRIGRVEDLPQGAWHELRIPLRSIQMHDKPIHGISFLQQGGGWIVWDRSAVVAGGKEAVFLDDEAKGIPSGIWEWAFRENEPVRSGTRAHTYPPPANQGDVASHALTELEEPVILHLDPPLDRPYLSQWVFLDPVNPPKTLAVDLRDGTRWAFRGVWGKRVEKGRYLGPLPKPGVWHELRIPLAWTPFLTRPIDGVAFGQVGGRVFWDHTALVVGAIHKKEFVLIEDETPPTRPHSTRREWLPWAQGHIGGTTPVPGKVGMGMLCDGHSGAIRVPPSPALDPPQFTLEAWIYAENLPPAGAKKWIINKNYHAGADGYFALLICGDKVVGDLNIGGGLPNRFEAWSPPGALKPRQWHHLAVSFDGADLKTYRDGDLVATTPVHRTRQPKNGPVYIGRWANWPDGYFAGIIDEARIYRRALSADELKARAAHPETLAPIREKVAEAVAGYWGFDSEVAPADPAAQWHWEGEAPAEPLAPVKSGKRAHTQPPGDGLAGHYIDRLSEPAVQHLPFDPSRATAVLRAQIPRLGLTDHAWAFFQDMLALQAKPGPRIELCQWFLRESPRHPRQLEALTALLEAHEEAGTPDPLFANSAVEAVIRKSDFSLKTLYRYYTAQRELRPPDHRSGHPPGSFVRSWQVLGPFPAPAVGLFANNGPPLPPDGGPVQLDGTCKGVAGDIRWTRHESPAALIDFAGLFRPSEDVVAYAACWVHSDRRRSAALAVGSDDGCIVWVNRRLVLRGSTRGSVTPGEFIEAIELSAGWNEVLVRVNNLSGPWGFCLELLDPLAREPLSGVRFSTTPPQTDSPAR